MRQFIDSVSKLFEGEVVAFPGNHRPMNPLAARGADIHHMKPDLSRLDGFTRAYIEAALWTARGDDGEPIDGEFGVDDLHVSAIEQMIEDCTDFQHQNEKLLDFAYHEIEGVNYDEEQAGHDFNLTRNRHGTGFWDRKLGKVGDALTKAAHAFGEADLYVEDGVIHIG